MSCDPRADHLPPSQQMPRSPVTTDPPYILLTIQIIAAGLRRRTKPATSSAQEGLTSRLLNHDLQLVTSKVKVQQLGSFILALGGYSRGNPCEASLLGAGLASHKRGASQHNRASSDAKPTL